MKPFILALWACCASGAQAQSQAQFSLPTSLPISLQTSAPISLQASLQASLFALPTALPISLPTSLFDMPTSLLMALPTSLSAGQVCSAITLTVGQVTSLQYNVSAVSPTQTIYVTAGNAGNAAAASSSAAAGTPLPSVFPGCNNGQTGTGLEGYGYAIFCDQGAGAGSVILEVLKKRTAVSYADCVTSCSDDILCVGIAWDSVTGTCTKYSVITSLVAASEGVNIIYKTVVLAAVESSLSAAAATSSLTTTTAPETTTTTTTTSETTTTTGK